MFCFDWYNYCQDHWSVSSFFGAVPGQSHNAHHWWRINISHVTTFTSGWKTPKAVSYILSFTCLCLKWRNKEQPQQLADKVDHALSKSESLVSDQNSFKTGFLEGYLKGKDDPKKSERWKGWTTFIVIGILGYIYLKMMSVFCKNGHTLNSFDLDGWNGCSPGMCVFI